MCVCGCGCGCVWVGGGVGGGGGGVPLGHVWHVATMMMDASALPPRCLLACLWPQIIAARDPHTAAHRYLPLRVLDDPPW